MIRLNPPQIVIISFLAAISCATFLLCLPVSVNGNEPLSFIDGLFTATSATCVTGLIVKDIGNYFSLFGQLVILFFIQIGGLGIMTFSTLFVMLIGRRLSMSQDLTIKNTLSSSRIGGVRDLVKYIIIVTFGIELLGALLLYLRWSLITNTDRLTVLKNAVFHSISAFCNSGLSLFSSSLMNFRSDTPTIFIMASLIIIGGLGFVVVLSIPRLRFFIPSFRRQALRHQAKTDIERFVSPRVSLHTRIILSMTLILIVGGMLGVLMLEHNYILKDIAFKDKLLASTFTAITPRTAGFNVLPTGALQPATKFFLMALMFIGASPGSTGGGIKTATAAVLIAGFFSMLCGRKRISLFGRTIERDVFRRSVTVFALAMGLVFFSTLLLTVTEKATVAGPDYFMNIFFETTSAFGTCGLSAGITPHLSALGKLIIIATMFIGRVGPLTLVLAVALREQKIDYRYPEEKIMVG